MRKGPANLVDVYELMCSILRLDCPPSFGNLTNIDDVFVEDALPTMKTMLIEGGYRSTPSTYIYICFPVFLLLRIKYLFL
uniref:Ovule protein n=1 Tax=Ascaris lumbricoides TaxID=6252 RepID=A0A0M3IBX9_ASCLU